MPISESFLETWHVHSNSGFYGGIGLGRNPAALMTPLMGLGLAFTRTRMAEHKHEAPFLGQHGLTPMASGPNDHHSLSSTRHHLWPLRAPRNALHDHRTKQKTLIWLSAQVWEVQNPKPGNVLSTEYEIAIQPRQLQHYKNWRDVVINYDGACAAFKDNAYLLAAAAPGILLPPLCLNMHGRLA